MAGPVKLMLLLRAANPGALDAFNQHWRNYLNGLLENDRLGGLIRIVHNEVAPVEVRSIDDEAVFRWDAVTEFWFDSRGEADAAVAAIRSNAGSGYKEEIVALATHLLVDERLLHDSGIRPLPVKILVFFKRRPDISRLDSQAYWHGPHARLGMVDYDATAFLKRYFQNHVLGDYHNADTQHEYDGSPEFWLESTDVLGMVGPDSDVMKAISEDEKNFADRASIVTLLVNEQEIFARDAQSAGWVAA